MSDETQHDFPYSLRIDCHTRYSIIRFPNDSVVYNALLQFQQSLPVDEFFSVTTTGKEISVIQDAKYPTYPQELGESFADNLKIEEGFVLIEVIPEEAASIDFGN
jgi:hypothetical protein